jgi:hypothetical protein
MPARDFVSLPSLPEGLTAWQRMFLEGIKENVELLIATRGDRRNWAVVKGDIETAFLNAATGVNISGNDVPTLDEFNALLVQFNDLLSRLK